MSVEIADLITVEGVKYITLETMNYEGKDYAFVNKVTDDEEITNEYYIFEVVGDGVVIISDYNLRNTLIPKFEELLKKDIEKIINE